MSIDSEQLPPIPVIEKAIAAMQRASREKARARRVRIIAITLIAAGAVIGIGANIAITLHAGGGLQWMQTWKVTAHWVGASGVVLLAAHMILAYLRRSDERFSARLARLERRSGAEDAHAVDDGGSGATVVSMPNTRVYELGVREGIRRARGWREDPPN